MRRLATLTAAAALAFGFAGAAAADHLTAPTGLTCDATADPVLLDWDDLGDAHKYSVDFRCTRTVDDVTTTVEFSIGTSERLDGGAIGDSDLEVAYDQLFAAAGMALGGFECFAKVKGLHAGNGNGPGQGRQNNPFSPESGCGTVAE